MKKVEKWIHILNRLSQCFTDYYSQDLIEYSAESLVKQHVFALALGYVDLNDDELRHDSCLALLSNKADPRALVLQQVCFDE